MLCNYDSNHKMIENMHMNLFYNMEFNEFNFVANKFEFVSNKIKFVAIKFKESTIFSERSTLLSKLQTNGQHCTISNDMHNLIYFNN